LDQHTPLAGCNEVGCCNFNLIFFLKKKRGTSLFDPTKREGEGTVVQQIRKLVKSKREER
jgi:hypothetical protein